MLILPSGHQRLRFARVSDASPSTNDQYNVLYAQRAKIGTADADDNLLRCPMMYVSQRISNAKLHFKHHMPRPALRSFDAG